MNKVFGTIIGVVGIAYAVLEFIPSIEPPQNMRYVMIPSGTPLSQSLDHSKQTN